MNESRRQFVRLAGAAVALPYLSLSSRAETYPARPVRILVGFSAGGNFDTVARLLGQSLSDRLGRHVIIENRPGASSNLATEAAIRAPADGYTLLLGGAVNAVNATLFERLNFSFARDTTPIAGVVEFPNVMAVGPAFPAASVAEFITYAKANPHRINHGSSGIGTTQHLAGELFKIMADVSFTHVPYRGAAPAITDLLSGQVQVVFEALPASIEFIRSGQIRALAVTTAQRSAALPALPTVAELLPGYEASGWSGLCAPKDTPAEVVAKLNSTVNSALADPSLNSRLTEMGAITLAGSPADFGLLIASETQKWAKVIRTANIRLG